MTKGKRATFKNRVSSRVRTGTKTGTAKTEKHPIDLETLHRQIEMKAYELFLSRDSTHGNDWDDWFEAEKRVKKGHKLT